jgi:hypothetical protein
VQGGGWTLYAVMLKRSGEPAMRRYRLRVRPDSKLASAVVGWDSDERHYVCELSHADGRTDQRIYRHLRELIFSMQWVAVLDDMVLRALLKDRARTAGGGR